jgi:nucleoid-associated protein YgaU
MLVSVALAGTLLLVGCRKKPEPISEVPPPRGDVRGDAVYVGPEMEPPITIMGADAPPPQPMTYQPPTPAGTGATSTGRYQPAATYQPVATPNQSQDQGPGGVHVVQRGETLWSIAVRYYGDGQRWRDIARVNDLADGNRLAAGQRLRLP